MSRQRCLNLVAIVAACVLVVGQIARSATITIGYPSGGQSYGIGAPIQYSGNGSWSYRNGENATGSVAIELVFSNNNALQSATDGVVVESDSPTLKYVRNVDGQATGPYSFKNNVDTNGNSTLVATQSNGARQFYFIRAIPIDVEGSPYPGGLGNPIKVYDVNNLGTIQ